MPSQSPAPARPSGAPTTFPGTRTMRLAIASAATAALLVAQPLAALAAPPTVTTPSAPIDYTEQAPAVRIGADITWAGGTGYGGGFIDFDVANGTADETLSLDDVAQADTTAGAVSIVGDTVYLGNGTGADVIGSVDPERDGTNGAMRIDFVSPFANPSFEEGTSIVGWTPIAARVDLGVTKIAGFTALDQSTYSTLNPSKPERPTNDDAAPDSGAAYSVQLSTADASDGSTSLELMSSMNTAGDCDVVHGPAVYSDPFEASSGDKIYFDWRAYDGGDNYHVYGYILNTATGQQYPVLDATGGNDDSPAFVTKETIIPANGSYRFVFVGGTHDLSCGQVAGARLLIDNVRVYGTKVNDAVVAEIADKVMYANASDDPETTRTVAVTAGDGQGTVSAAGDIEIRIAPVDDVPSLDPIDAIALTNREGPQTYPATAGRITASDPDSTLSYTVLGETKTTASIAGVTYDRQKRGTYGTLHLDATSGRYAYVPDAAAVDARRTNDGEEFTVVLIAPDKAGLGTPESLSRTLAVSIAIAETAPGAPAAPTATAGVENAQLTWTAPDWTAATAVTGYAVEKSTDGGAHWDSVTADTGDADAARTIDDLTAQQPVVFRVAAINAYGQGAWSPASAPVSPYTTPSAPASVTAEAADRTVYVSWTAPESNGGSDVTGYRVEFSRGDDPWQTLFADTGRTGTSVTTTGLVNGTPVRYRISALNAAGAGPAIESDPVTPRTVPGAPADVVAAPADGAVELTWSAPASDGGAAITGYRIETSADGDVWELEAEDTGTTDRAYTIDGLPNGQAVSFRISAINVAGTGPATSAGPATPRTMPDAPTGLAAQARDESVDLTWTAPAEDGGAAVTGYRIEVSLDGGETWSPAVADTGSADPSATVEGLTNGAAATFRVSAINDAGAGAPSGTASVTPRTVPDAPEPLTATPQDRSVALSWSAPVDDGGAAVSGYRIEQSVDGGENWTEVSADTGSTQTSALVTGLENGTAIEFRVSAINEAGAGTAAVATATPRTVADAPVGLAATPQDAAAALTWTEPDWNGGAAVTGYRIETSVDDGRTWSEAVADTGSAAGSGTVSGLGNGTRTALRVAAINDAGVGAWAVVETTPRRPAGEVVIDGIRAGNRSLTVSFTSPADDGGAPITGYEYSLDGGKTWVAAKGTTSPLVIEGLRNGTEYGVLLRALNAAGSGSVDEAQTVAPVLQPVTGADGEQASALPGRASATVSGASSPVTTGREGSTWLISGDGFEIRIDGLDAEGMPLEFVGGALVAPAGGSLRARGSGFLPGSALDLWLLDAGLLLGEPLVGDDGTFDTILALPAGVRIGEESLQLNGLDADGRVRSLVAGFGVVAPEADEDGAGGLAITGGDAGTSAVAGTIALLLLVVGGVLVLPTRARARSVRSHS